MNRRELLTSAGLAAGAGAAWSSLLAPVRAVAAEARPIRIKNIESFTIVLPATETEIQAGVLSRATAMRVETESGVRGYAFNSGVNRGAAAGRAAPPAAAAGRGSGAGGAPHAPESASSR